MADKKTKKAPFPEDMLRSLKEARSELDNPPLSTHLSRLTSKLDKEGKDTLSLRALVLGVRGIDKYLKSPARKEKQSQLKKLRRALRRGGIMKTGLSIVLPGTTIRDLKPWWLDENGVEEMKTLTIIGFMNRVGDTYVTRERWYPLTPLLHDSFKLGSRTRPDPLQAYKAGKDRVARKQLLKDTIRSRVAELLQQDSTLERADELIKDLEGLLKK